MKLKSLPSLVPYSLLVSLAVPGVVEAADEKTRISATVDAYYKSDNTALGGREDGLGLGHTELSVQHQIADLFSARLTAIAEVNDVENNGDIEEAYLETLSLPAGLSVRAGRFLADLGYLNGQHSHADNFVERPLVYRGFLGNHYFDDGLGVRAVLPTDIYWQLSVAAFTGDHLGNFESGPSVGAWTLATKVGDDIDESQSWQAGVSYLRNRMDLHAGHEEEHEEEEDHEHEEEHAGHSHGAAFSGEHMYIADAVWKWSPSGNNKSQQLSVSAEYFKVTDISPEAGAGDHDGWYTAAVYRFAPEWSVGLRYGELNARQEHEEGVFENADLRETTLMAAWNPTHTQTVRLQYTHQDAEGIEGEDNAVTLQYLISFGAHDAHSF